MTERTCTADGCDRPVLARAMCGMHYQRWLKVNGPQPRPKVPCSIDGCDRTGGTRGLCKPHYQQWWRREGATTTCSLCDAPVFSLGWCRKHYRRNRRWGDPLRGDMPQGLSDRERVEWYTNKTDTCWLWTGTVANTGYGHIYRKGGPVVGAHRLSYEVHVDPIPEGLTIDHLCRVPLCVNPDHLEPVTQSENNRRAWDVRRAK